MVNDITRKVRVREVGVQYCMITQQLKSDLWKLAPHVQSDLDAVYFQDINLFSEMIYQQLTNADMFVDAVYGIFHDRDKSGEGDNVVYKEKHVHFVVVFNKANKYKVVDVAYAVGLEHQFVEKPKAGRYSKDNMLSYLIHAKDANKEQYSADEVASVLGSHLSDSDKNDMLYTNIAVSNAKSWERGRLNKKHSDIKIDLPMLKQLILDGVISNSRELVLNDDYCFLYAENRSKINDFFKVALDLKVEKTRARLENGEIKTRVFYVQGGPGVGKTSLAKKIAKDYERAAEERGEKWSTYHSSSQNAFDQYAGEEITILDDLRPNSMSVSDWLRVLDPYNIQKTTARYNDKTVISQIIIITSVYDYVSFFDAVREHNRSESIDQFFRRLEFIIKVINPKEASVSLVAKHDTALAIGYNGDYHHYRAVDNAVYLNIDDGQQNIIDMLDDIKNGYSDNVISEPVETQQTSSIMMETESEEYKELNPFNT